MEAEVISNQPDEIEDSFSSSGRDSEAHHT